MSIFGICYLHNWLKQYSFGRALFIVVAFLFIGEYYTYVSLPALDQTKDRIVWSAALAYINRHDPQDSYLSPLFTIEAVRKGWPVYDNGQTEYYSDSELTQSSQRFGMLVGPSRDVAPRSTEWQNELNDKIINKKFSFIVLRAGWHRIVNDDYLAQYYVLKQQMNFPSADLGPIEFGNQSKFRHLGTFDYPHKKA